MSTSKRPLSDEFVESSSEETSDTEIVSKKAKKDTNTNETQLVNSDNEPYFKLGTKKRLTVRKWKNMVLLDFREYYTDKATNEERPTKKGISLTVDQWKIIKASLKDIDEAIEKVSK